MRCTFQNGNLVPQNIDALAKGFMGSGSYTADHKMELQLKGAGTTPFCRGFDGRAVLRSSLREFIASEAMFALGVRTTRALSLIVSQSSKLARSHPTHGGLIYEKAAITCRVAPSNYLEELFG